MGPGCSHWTGSRLQAGAPSAGKAGGSRGSKCQGNHGHNPDDYMDPRAEEANLPIKPELFQPEKQWVTWKTKPRELPNPLHQLDKRSTKPDILRHKSLCKEQWERNIYIPLPCVISNLNTLETAMGTLGLSQPPSKSHLSHPQQVQPVARWLRWTNNSFSFPRKNTSSWACLCPSWFYRNWPTPSELRSPEIQAT